MNVWITRSGFGVMLMHAEKPQWDADEHRWTGRESSARLRAIVPDAEWDSLGPGECKKLTLPEAFDPDGPVEVGDYVRTPGDQPAIVEQHCGTFVRFREPNGVLYQTAHEDLTILAKAPKPAPEPVPEPLPCRHCTAAPHCMMATVDVLSYRCPNCKQSSPDHYTLTAATLAWNDQNETKGT